MEITVGSLESKLLNKYDQVRPFKQKKDKPFKEDPTTDKQLESPRKVHITSRYVGSVVVAQTQTRLGSSGCFASAT